MNGKHVPSEENSDITPNSIEKSIANIKAEYHVINSYTIDNLNENELNLKYGATVTDVELSKKYGTYGQPNDIHMVNGLTLGVSVTGPTLSPDTITVTDKNSGYVYTYQKVSKYIDENGDDRLSREYGKADYVLIAAKNLMVWILCKIISLKFIILM